VDVDGLTQLGLRSYLGVPLASRGEVLGTICIFGIEPLAIQPATLALLQAVGHQVGVAVENARLFDQAQARAQELVVLNELVRSLSARRTTDQVLAEVCEGASRLLDASSFQVGLYDPVTDRLAFPYGVAAEQEDALAPMFATEAALGYVIRNRRSVLIEEDVPERLAQMGIEGCDVSALSWLGVPITVGDQVLGAMAVHSDTVPRAYNEHDRELLEALASQTAIALQNARLLQESQRRAERERVTREISDDIRAAVSVDDAVQRAIRQLGRALGASEIVARIGSERDLVGLESGDPAGVPQRGNGHG
jgi:GAF domain-containing protein